MFPFSSFSFNPEKDIPSLEGKVIVVTGGNSGLGLESLIQMAKHSPSKVYLCARNKEKYDTAMKHVAESGVPEPTKFVHFLELDLQSLASVKKSAETFKAENQRLDILMNNAGIMAQPASLTKDGYEAQFGTNHVGHALFTKLLLPTLEKTAAEPNSDVRIINLSSEGHKFAPKAGFVPEACKTDMADYSTWTRYGQSKLANILFTRVLAEKYPVITSVAIHPGVVMTNLAGPFMESHPYLTMAFQWVLPSVMATPVVGAYNQTWAATAPVVGKAWTEKAAEGGKKAGMKLVTSGNYYVPVAKDGGDNKISKDMGLARKLWDWTEKELQEKGY